MTTCFILAACGGRDETPPASDAGSVGVARGDGATEAAQLHPGPDAGPLGDAVVDAAPPSPVCPATKPAAGSSCTVSGATCEYGDDPAPYCDAVLDCSDGTWVLSSAFVDGGCSTTNPPICPAEFADISQGGACGGTTDFECYYPEARCACGPVVLEGACAQPDCPASTWDCDTAASESGNTLTPEPGCPEPRPRIGAFCSDADSGKSCDYGHCQGGVLLVCTSNAWRSETEACPL